MNWNGRLNGARGIVFNTLYIFYIISLMLPVPWVDLFLSVLSFLALLLALFGLGKLYQLIVSFTLSFTLILIALNDLFTWEAIYYFSSMTNVLVLITYASLFSIPVYLGAYPRKIYSFFQNRVHTFKGLYATYSTITFILCSVMAAAAIPTVQSSLSRFLRRLPASFRKEFQTVTFVRPFIMTLFWTPVAAAPTIAISGTDAKASVVLSITFTLAIIFMFVDIMTSNRRLNKKIVEEDQGNREEEDVILSRQKAKTSRKTKISLVLFLGSIVFFIGVVLSINHWLEYSVLDSVVMMLIPYSLIWSLTLKRGRRYFQTLRYRFAQDVPKLSQQVALFISIGLMINVIEHTQLNDAINSSVLIVKDILGPFVLLFISLITFMVTWTGIFPQLVVVLATQTIDLQQVGLTPEWFAITVLGGALTGSASSPFTVNANIVAVTIKESPINIVKHNIIFALSILLVTSIIAIGLQFFIGPVS